ncbi:MFS transporter [Streptomyces sp. HNM0574]|nr:MFS transporter [Streptomyces sp. HNM0574]
MQTPAAPSEVAEAGAAGRRAVLAATGTATFVALMNYTAPMLTLPGMGASFGAGPSGQAWLINGIALGLAAVLLVAGGLADDHGRKRVFVTGAFGLAVTAALGAAAGSTLAFTLARVAQGAASAALIASSLGLIAHAFPAGPGRNRATGIWGAALSGGIAFGPVAAAGLAAVDWRLVYAVYAAAMLAVGGYAARALTESRGAPGARGRPDLGGALLLGLSAAALLAALTLGRDGWLRPAVGVLLLAGAVLGAGFVLVERRVSAPLLDLALFRRPSFLVATSGALFTGLGVIGLFSYLPALLRQTMGLPALGSAWLLCLWSATALLVALQVRRLPAAFTARRQLALGFALAAAGTLTMLGVPGSGSWPALLPGFLLAGAGSGLLNAALPRLAVESVPADRASMGSGANNTARYIGSAMGVSLAMVVASSAHGTDPAALAQGTDRALLTGAALMVLGAVTALALRGRASAAVRQD